MNYPHIALAGLGAFVGYMILGAITFALLPLREEFRKYPAVYRPQEEIMKAMPAGMAAMLMAMLALAVMYALSYRGGSGLAGGARFGALIGIFSIGAFVVHNYVNLNIGLALTMQQSVAYFVEWLVSGIAIGLIYRPKSS